MTGIRAFSIIVFILSALGGLPTGAQERDHRHAFGGGRTALMESLVAALYPGANHKWDPDLQVQNEQGSFAHVQFPGLTFKVTSDGETLGVTSVELANEKAQTIFKAKHFRQDGTSRLPTSIVVFRADTRVKITDLRKLELDPVDPLSEIKLIRMPDWSKGQWPIIEIRYISHLVGVDSYTQIEWQSSFDSKQGKLIARAPLGTVTVFRNGNEVIRMFSIRRVSSTQVDVTDALSKSAKPYSCVDPCIIDGPTLLAQWSQ